MLSRVSIANQSAPTTLSTVLVYTYFSFVFTFLVGPDAHPVNVTGFNKSSTSLFVEWQHIPPQHRNGILLGYKIFYNPRNSDQPKLSVIVNSTRSSTVLTKLIKYTWYDITVAGFTSKGLGPQPLPLVIRTSEDGRSRDSFVEAVD